MATPRRTELAEFIVMQAIIEDGSPDEAWPGVLHFSQHGFDGDKLVEDIANGRVSGGGWSTRDAAAFDEGC